MKFKKCCAVKPAKFTWTVSPQRLAAAKRAVKKDKESVSLFPEMATHQTPEARLDALKINNQNWQNNTRIQKAFDWRRARKSLNTLSQIERAGVLTYWNHPDVWLPRDPCYLLSLVHDVKVKKASAWRKLRILRQFKLIVEKRLPSEIADSIRAWD